MPFCNSPFRSIFSKPKFVDYESIETRPLLVSAEVFARSRYGQSCNNNNDDYLDMEDPPNFDDFMYMRYAYLLCVNICNHIVLLGLGGRRPPVPRHPRPRRRSPSRWTRAVGPVEPWAPRPRPTRTSAQPSPTISTCIDRTGGDGFELCNVLYDLCLAEDSTSQLTSSVTL